MTTRLIMKCLLSVYQERNLYPKKVLQETWLQCHSIQVRLVFFADSLFFFHNFIVQLQQDSKFTDDSSSEQGLMSLDANGRIIINVDQNGLPMEIRPGENKPRIPTFVLENPEYDFVYMDEVFY